MINLLAEARSELMKQSMWNLVNTGVLRTVSCKLVLSDCEVEDARLVMCRIVEESKFDNKKR